MKEPENLHAHAQSRDTDDSVTAHQGANVNKTVIRVDASALSIIALMLSVAAIVVALSQAIFSPQLVDAKIQAGIARSAEEAHAANVKAQLTERDLTIVREALQKKGIDLPPKD